MQILYLVTIEIKIITQKIWASARIQGERDNAIMNDNIMNKGAGADLSSLPMNALSEVPTPNENAQQIVALVKDEGKISGYKLSDERIVSKEEGVNLARAGEIEGVGISSRKGNEYLKSLPDASEGNNLSSLPSLTKDDLGY